MESTTRHEQYLSLMFKQYFGEKTMTDVFIKYNFMGFFLFCSLTIIRASSWNSYILQEDSV